MILLLCTCIAFVGANHLDTPTFSEKEWDVIKTLSPAKLEEDKTNRVSQNPDAAALGKKIFFDPSFSSNHKVSCSTCHIPELYFTDGKSTAIGIKPLSRNTPTVVNAAHQRWFFWDGRSDVLWGQPIQTFEHPDEMNVDRVHIAKTIESSAELTQLWTSAFGSLPDLTKYPMHAKPTNQYSKEWNKLSESQKTTVNKLSSNVAKAVAAYITSLDATDAPFDAFVRGNEQAISASAKRGLQLFIGEAGCLRCHFGPWFSDGAFHSVGVGPITGGLLQDSGRADAINKLLEDQFTAASTFSDDPNGPRATITKHIAKRREDWGAFRTPSLRNVAQTAPYMHAGQLMTLEDVLEHYSTLKNFVSADHHRETILEPLNLTEQQIKDLISFLESLTAPLPDTSIPKASE